MALCGRVDDFRIGRMNQHATDATCALETHPGPVPAGVGRSIDAVADRDVAAQKRLAGAEPDDIRITRRDGDGADGTHAQRVGDGGPSHTAVGAFPKAAAGGAGVVGAVLTGDARDRDHTVAVRADETPGGELEEGGVEGRRSGRRRCRGRRGRSALGEEQRGNQAKHRQRGLESHRKA